jgi:ubiquinone/menaquinone biosynthesis C-methylase UbiE
MRQRFLTPALSSLPSVRFNVRQFALGQREIKTLAGAWQYFYTQSVKLDIPLPVETDYPPEVFRSDLAPEYRVGCAWAYFKTNFLARRLFRQRVDIAFDLMPSAHCKRALDAGTGAGFILPGLASRCREVDAVDLSPVMYYTQRMLDKRGLHNVKLTEADLLQLPFVNLTFDLAVCLSVIEHIPDPEAVLTELGRVLRYDGVLILGYPLEHGFFVTLEKMCRIEKRLRLRIQGKPLPQGKAFHPHVTDCRRLEKKVDKILKIEARRDVRIVGVPVYRILKLRKTAIKA